MTYQQKLRDPRWQRKRLLIFDRDRFTCCKCKSDEKELQVHHLNYRTGKQPWEYDDRELITLCIDCHFYETILQLFDRYQLQGQITKLAFAFGNCKGDEGKLETIIDIIYRISTMTAEDVQRFYEACNEASFKSFNG